ncbi:MAG: bacteriochlorophyll 4-vinyl reductase [Gemmatimonadales bacterium]|nr:bacteriochlorophyll 4-vinyl reductase [Gemmatimonadales bacterium]
MTAAVAGRIGPNAILQTAIALDEEEPCDVRRRIFDAAGLAAYLREPPTRMVPEAEVMALGRAVHRELGEARAGEILARAGELTGAYVLEHRIPAPVRLLLRLLPPTPAARLLLRSITAHQWTFVGTGTFAGTAAPGRATLVVSGSPMARGVRTHDPACRFYAATFGELFRRLVSPRATAREVACAACGAARCTFEVRW